MLFNVHHVKVVFHVEFHKSCMCVFFSTWYITLKLEIFKGNKIFYSLIECSVISKLHFQNSLKENKSRYTLLFKALFCDYFILFDFFKTVDKIYSASRNLPLKACFLRKIVRSTMDRRSIGAFYTVKCTHGLRHHAFYEWLCWICGNILLCNL